MSAVAKERALDRIAELAGRGQDLVSFWLEATEALEAVLSYYQDPCWYTLDPASLLITSRHHGGVPEYPREWLVADYYDDDVNRLAEVGRSAPGISTLHEITGGDPSDSPRWHRFMELGGDQELIASLRTSKGAVWGALGLYREPGKPMFSRDELAFVAAAAPDLARGARTALLVGEAREPQWPDSPCLVVISDTGEIESFTPGTERRLADFPDGEWEKGLLPSAVQAVAARARRTAKGTEDPGEIAVSRVLGRSGTWVVLHGTSLVASGPRRVAVIVEPAHPARIVPLLMSAYGLTEREQEVTRLVLQGESTAQIAGGLVLSPHTVQEHLKSIFEKTGVRSRRELVGKVFFAHYEPRLRDNEARATSRRPVRGEPFPG
jgi:DNA-binding CsgD family transcriptional regulator